MKKTSATGKIPNEYERFRLQRIATEIKTIGDRSTLLLGYLVIILTTLTAFIFAGFGETGNQLRELSTGLLGVSSVNATILLGILIACIGNPYDDEVMNIKKFSLLRLWFRAGIIIAFIPLISVLGVAIYFLFL